MAVATRLIGISPGAQCRKGLLFTQLIFMDDCNMDTTMSERRLNPRFEVSLDAVWDGGLSSGKARVADLSEGGCYVDSIHDVYVGELHRFKLQLPNGQWFPLSGEVAYHIPRMGFGVRFIGLRGTQIDNLRSLISYLLPANEDLYSRRVA